MTAIGHSTTQLDMSELIVAKHTAYAVFKIPNQYKELPLVCFDVCRDILYIYSEECPRKLLCEVKASLDVEDAMDWKRPDEIFFSTKDEFPYSREESDDEEEDNKTKEALPWSGPTGSFCTLMD